MSIREGVEGLSGVFSSSLAKVPKALQGGSFSVVPERQSVH